MTDEPNDHYTTEDLLFFRLKIVFINSLYLRNQDDIWGKLLIFLFFIQDHKTQLFKVISICKLKETFNFDYMI